MNDQEALRQFIDNIRWLYEPEYGDFKRKVGLYIQRLEEANPQLKSGHAKKVMTDMRSVVVFTPNGDIESTRRQVIRMAQDLLVGASSGPTH
ncbi:MAG TPA: hypothetical protein PKC28_08885 [Bdellovibrionales bacterium]|nr:hypothetical protein [Bdellovibrionales bacterium]